MSVLAWIIVAGMAMSGLALVGTLSAVIRESLFRRLVMPLVAPGQGGFHGLAVGSTTHKLLHLAGCPMAVVHAHTE